MIPANKSYDIVLDGFGTIYDKDFCPIRNANQLIREFGNKITLFSNTGSISGASLRKKLPDDWQDQIFKVMTPVDVFIKKYKGWGTFSHYGSDTAKFVLESNGIKIANDMHSSNAIVFSSLPSENWISKSQEVMQKVLDGSIDTLFLINPDRVVLNPHIGINVGMMFDMLLSDLRKHIDVKVFEIGKPNLSRADLSLGSSSRVLVIGDNPQTDGGLAESIGGMFFNVSDVDDIVSEIESNEISGII